MYVLNKIILILALTILSYSCNNTDEQENKLPYVGNFDVEYRTENGREIADTIYPKIPDFEYLNQDSVLITSKSMKGKVWIADFFFTSCPTICPKMTEQMKRLSIMTKDLEKYMQFMSFSINPKTDQPSVLRRYIKSHGISASNWYFFTGDEEQTHELGVKYFNVFANKDIESEGGYAHSPAFVLIDKKGYVRGVYVGTQTEQVNLLEKDIRKLLKYEYKNDIRE
jgi:protein SCO1/2